jgi:hypothetical protein
VDTDGDGAPDSWNTGKTAGDSTSTPALVEDLDDDNDGVNDDIDACPLDSSETAYTTYYEDGDSDGLGDNSSSADYCPGNEPAGWVADNTDPLPNDPFNNSVMLVGDDSAIALGRAVEMSDDGLVIAVLADDSSINALQIFRRSDRTNPFVYSDKEAIVISHSENVDSGWNGNLAAISLSGDGNILALGEPTINQVRVFHYSSNPEAVTIATTTNATYDGLTFTRVNEGYADNAANFVAGGGVGLYAYDAGGGTWYQLYRNPPGSNWVVNTITTDPSTFTTGSDMAGSGGAVAGSTSNETNLNGYIAPSDVNSQIASTSAGGGSWSLADTIVRTDITETTSDTNFGLSVSVDADGEYLAISSNLEPYIETTSNRGRVVILHSTDPSTNTWDTKKAVLSDDVEDGDNFGSSLSFSNDAKYLVVGASQKDSGAGDSGEAYIYSKDDLDDTIWTLEQTFMPSNPETDSGFGTRVKISADGTVVFISSPFAEQPASDGSSHGAIEIYKYDGSDSWDFAQVIQDTDSGLDTPYFGLSLDTSSNGEMLIVGSVDLRLDISGTIKDIGRTYLYEFKSGTSEWEEKYTHSPDFSEVDNSNARFGAGVAISSDGTAYAIGARGHQYDSGSGNKDAGSVWSNAPD